MSFIDKAKQKLLGVPKGLGEETVRIVDYDELSDAELKSGSSSKKKSTTPKVKPAPKPKPAPKVKDSPKAESPKLASTDDTVFEIEEKNLFSGKSKKPDAVDKIADDLIPTSSEKIKDVLEVLNIPDTFEIENSIFMPDDLDEVNFDQQAPVGYDIGQVSAFVEQCRKSLSHYVGLLKLRNEHVAKLATVVDRLQVDLNNAIFDREVANGINIMPTQDDGDLERDNFELKLLVKRLTEQLDEYKNGDNLSSSERVLLETIQDELSVARRELEDKKSEIYDLKNQVAYYEENGTDEEIDEDDLTDHAFNYESNDEDEDSGSFGFDTLPEVDEDALPLVDDDEGGMELPPIDDFNPSESNRFAPKVHENSAFFGGDDQPLEEFLEENLNKYEDPSVSSMIEIMDDDDSSFSQSKPRTIGILNYDEDDDDDLDQIMKEEWGNK